MEIFVMALTKSFHGISEPVDGPPWNSGMARISGITATGSLDVGSEALRNMKRTQSLSGSGMIDASAGFSYVKTSKATDEPYGGRNCHCP